MATAQTHGVLSETILAQSEHTIELEVAIPALCDYFDGHFPQFKLLPAVAQVDLVSLYAHQYLHTPRAVQTIKRCKFSEKILPETRVVFSLSYDAEKRTVSFKIADACTKVAYSSGAYTVA